ncbi:MAG: hypothetical protein HYU27_03675 [Acidobacteria bacterium]|nr:hypothetical protein [Acidobacteriota bacterium]
MIFGVIADLALVDQARLAANAAIGEADEKAPLAAASVRAALADVEQDVLTGKRSPQSWSLRKEKRLFSSERK